MRSATYAVTAIAMLALCGPENAHAQVRAKAEVSCRPGAEKLQYDCIIKLANSRTSEPLSGLTLMVGADMPSMPRGAQCAAGEGHRGGGQGLVSGAHRA